MNLVSIIIPYYKKETFIKKTIKSILNQTYREFEIIIVNDEGSLESEKILQNLKEMDSRIFLKKNDYNLGAGYSRNEGIKISKGKYLAFCDADDIWNEHKLEKQINFMLASDLKFCFTAYNIIDNNDTIIGNRKAVSQISFNELIRSCDIGLSTVILEKKVIEDLKVYFPNTKTKEDYIFWLMLAKNGIEIFGIQENLSSWRKLDNSLSSSILQKLLDGYKVYRIFLRFSIFKSLISLFILSINRLLKN